MFAAAKPTPLVIGKRETDSNDFMIFPEFLAAVIERVPFAARQTIDYTAPIWSDATKIALLEPTLSADSVLVQMHDSLETDWRVALVPANLAGVEIAAAGIRAFLGSVRETVVSANG